MRKLRLVLLGGLLLAVSHLCAPVSAIGQEDPDTEIARRHFDKASKFYDAKEYEKALREFEAARKVKPLPAFDFNIGRCNDRLENFAQAIVYYERYARSNPADVAQVRARIELLKQRVAEEAS